MKAFRCEPKNVQGVHSFSNFFKVRQKQKNVKTAGPQWSPIPSILKSFPSPSTMVYTNSSRRLKRKKKKSQVWEKAKALLKYQRMFLKYSMWKYGSRFPRGISMFARRLPREPWLNAKRLWVILIICQQEERLRKFQ